MAAPLPAQTAPCALPVEIPEGALGAGPVERLWADDRIALVSCGERHQAVVEFYRERDAGLAGKENAQVHIRK